MVLLENIISISLPLIGVAAFLLYFFADRRAKENKNIYLFVFVAAGALLVINLLARLIVINR